MKKRRSRIARWAKRNVGRKAKSMMATSILLVVGLGFASAPAVASTIAQLNCGSPAECRNIGQAYLNQGKDMAASDRRTAVAIMTEQGPTATPVPVTVVVERTVVVPVRETVVVPATVMVPVQTLVYVTVAVPIQSAPEVIVVTATAAPIMAGPPIGERIANVFLPQTQDPEKKGPGLLDYIFFGIIVLIVGAFVYVVWLVVIKPLIPKDDIRPPTDWWG